MKIALCNDIPEFQSNRCLDENWCRRFPGATWMPCFAELAMKKGFDVVSGDIALSNIRKGSWKAEDVLVIQELNARYGRKLIHSGAKPAILTCFESPLIAYSFYDKLPQIAPRFWNRILFSGAFSTFNASSGFNCPLRFPNFNAEDIKPLKPWDEREFLVMIASNKHWNQPLQLSIFRNPKRTAWWMLEQWGNRISPTRTLAIKNELQCKRFEAVEYFGSLNRMALFGMGWNEPNRMPSDWSKRLKELLQNLNPTSCKDKFETASNYKYAICFENVSYPSYITEKIIDCFVSGVIPIYLGAPDVADFIPKEAFIDMRKFDSWKSLNIYLEEITEKDALKMLYAGRDFLNCSKGKLHSNKGFAQNILDILIKGGYAE